MSDDVSDSAKVVVLRGLRNLVHDGIRGRHTRDEIIHSLHQRGLKRETARAFLESIESSNSGLNELLDRNEEDALLRRLSAVVNANYEK